MSTPVDLQSRLVPKLWTVLQEGYSWDRFRQDLFAGLIVGIVALPLSLAFAIASGVKPEQGLYTAIIGGFLISVLGGSRCQIGGPTGAFIVIVYGVVQEFGYEGLAVATLLAGVLLIAMGVAKLGAVVKFVPYPVTVGFTSGIALIIATSQVREFLGLQMESVPGDFIPKIEAYATHISTWNPYAVAVGLASLLIVVSMPRLTRRVPGPIVALLATTAAVQLLSLPVETIGGRFGEVPNMLPTPSIPKFDLALVRDVSPAALSIALLAAIESLLSAVVADGMAGTHHRSNMELVAQGVANLASPIFGGIPATGAIARTATNIRNGGRTPIAGIVHSVTLLLILLFLGRWAALVPIPALAGILLVVSYNMSEWRVFRHLFRSPRSDVAVLLITFFLTVLVDLTVALEVGIVLAAFLFMRRMAMLAQVGYATEMLREEEDGTARDPNAIATRSVPEGVAVFEIYGPFFFGAASKFKDALAQIQRPPKVLILRMREVHGVDATALRALQDVLEKARKDGTQVVLSGAPKSTLNLLDRSGLLNELDARNICRDIDDALARSRQIVGAD
ncbi:MAG: sulfate permease [Candidatus Eisenbacteria bacterium]